MNYIKSINEYLNGLVWGLPMIMFILGTGILLSLKTRFFQVTKVRLWINETVISIFKKKEVTEHTVKDEKTISPFQAMSTALAATIGVGNIAGVSGAIITGGPGAVFWMWVSAIFGMMTGYGENVLGIYYRKKDANGQWNGGAMYYLEEGLKEKKHMKVFAKPLAVLFSVFCIGASFGMGNMTQVHEISKSIKDSFNIEDYILIGRINLPSNLLIGIICGLVTAAVIIGGIKTIGLVTEKFVPLMAAVYVFFSLIVILPNVFKLPMVICSIVKSAFGIKPVSGAVMGISIKNVISSGFKRGIFSNEAGLGSSVLVHSASNIKEPAEQGMWSIFEVFFDTIIMCTLTAFVILCSGIVNLKTGEIYTNVTGASVVSKALEGTLGTISGKIVALEICFFAFSTVIGWSYYGIMAWKYLFGEKNMYLYKALYIIFVIYGATMNFELAWGISDTLNGLMALPNLIGVLLLSDKVVNITDNYIRRKIKHEKIEPAVSGYDKKYVDNIRKT